MKRTEKLKEAVQMMNEMRQNHVTEVRLLQRGQAAAWCGIVRCIVERGVVTRPCHSSVIMIIMFDSCGDARSRMRYSRAAGT